MIDRFDPVAFHRLNIMRMRGTIVVIPSYPCAGAALLGNILLEMGLHYFDPYTELLVEDGSSVPVEERAAYRARLAASFHQDQYNHRFDPTSPIYCKTHLYPTEFAGHTLSGVIVLTRDPRDAIHSHYHWRRGFSEDGEKGTFVEFLQRGTGLGHPPVEDWIAFYGAWLEIGGQQDAFAIIRFEDLKTVPHQTIHTLLTVLGITHTAVDIERAIEQSSFERMRRHEDTIAKRDTGESKHARIMRRGKVNEWQEWYNRELATYFAVPELAALAQTLGYEM